MSQVIDKAVEKLNARLSEGFGGGLAKFVIEDEGAILVDASGARPGDGAADVTLSASRETFEGLLAGAVNPMSAYMTGKLKIEGNMAMAMQLGTALA